MTPSEIISQDKYSQKDGADKVLAGIAKLVKDDMAVILQSGNTVLVVVRLGDGAVEVHVYTTDTGLALMSAIKVLIQKLVNSDIQVAYISDPRDANMLKALEINGLKVMPSDRPEYKWMITR
jgi:DeoR/GlpR family transcriptional regulator of sugar metabolism